MQLFQVQIPVPFHPGNLRALRAAIAERVGFEHELFHQHDNRQGGYHWNYPLIQYSVRRGEIQIIGINQGAKALKEQLLPRLGTSLILMGEKLNIPACTFRERKAKVALSPQRKICGLRNWLALNQTNYRAWQKCVDREERAVILNRALTGHLRLLAKGLGVKELDHIHGKVVQINQRKRVYWKNVPMIQFQALVQTNLDYPREINLGRLAAYGYGEQLTISQYTRLTKQIETGRAWHFHLLSKR